MLKFIITLILLSPLAQAEWLPLWPQQAPGAAPLTKGIDGVAIPQYQVFSPKTPNGKALIIFPGGGYGRLAMKHEGFDIAHWCVSQGVTAILVQYRVSKSLKANYHFPVPLLDARRAIRTVRYNAEKWNISASKIGVIGFSAGGHLASLTANTFDTKYEAETNDPIDQASARPDFHILVYPVISMGTPHTHKGSENHLLGKDADQDTRKSFNTSAMISKKTPPLYFSHAADDKGVPLQNILDYISACVKKGVSTTGAIHATGGHGYGKQGRGAATGWMKGLETWLNAL